MTTKVVGVALACATVLLPLGSAWAQVEHAQRLALEVAIRRAQVRTMVCEQPRTQYTQPTTRGATGDVTTRLPSSPPVGTAGPVDCGRAAWPWPLGR